MIWPQPIIRAGRITDDLECLKGDDLSSVLTFYSVNDSTGVKTLYDFTNCTALMHVRAVAGDSTVVLTASTAAGTLVLGGTAGTVTFAVPAATMAAVAAGTYVYDLQLTWPDGRVETLLRPAAFKVEEDVTK
jgi:hypothetical protein